MGRERLGIGLGLGSWGGGGFRGDFFLEPSLSKIKLLLLKILNQTENFVALLFHLSKLLNTRNINFLLFCYLLFYLIIRHQQNWFKHVKRTLSKKITDWKMELLLFHSYANVQT